jgi:hypothetical protein
MLMYTVIVRRLNKMVAGKRAEPGPELVALFRSCGGPEVEQAVKARIQALADLFTARYTAPTENHPGSQVQSTGTAWTQMYLFFKDCPSCK